MAPRRILLDTSAYAHFRRGHAEVVELLATAERVFLSAVTIGELEAGFALGTRSDDNRQALRDFLAEPFVSVVDIHATIAARYGALFASLRRAGTPIPTNDIWIASSALHVGAQLITFDTDFERFGDSTAVFSCRRGPDFSLLTRRAWGCRRCVELHRHARLDWAKSNERITALRRQPAGWLSLVATNQTFVGALPTRMSAGMPRASRRRRIMASVSGRRPLRISETRARLPISGSRSARLRPSCSMRKRIASIGSGAAMAWCCAS